MTCNYNRHMRRKTTQSKPPAAVKPGSAPSPARGAATSRLRSQTRKQLGKHYRAKYGVR